jgi:hypothetical protein
MTLPFLSGRFPSLTLGLPLHPALHLFHNEPWQHYNIRRAHIGLKEGGMMAALDKTKDTQ